MKTRNGQGPFEQATEMKDRRLLDFAEENSLAVTKSFFQKATSRY